ncbi:Cupredoxin [Diplogelasinospora grovesii]|uniref:Cupredoxin n=1 Tax=Diplogelasinospora grovesii TaxID=303347 RepID=A0AAN6N6G0_9PEZI|nr:Cupredoxin [Diplogelasinospora grovesii]
MQFTTLALAALASMATAQKTTVVTVAMNGTLTYSPNNIKVNAGEFVQFQFTAGNHTVTQSTFDAPCQPISMHSNVTGFHSGFQPAAASASMGMIPTYTIQVNNTTPLWVYCAQAKHCEAGMVMVINENTAANASRSLVNYKSLAAKATTVVPGGSATTNNGGTTGTTSGTGSSTSSGVSAAGAGAVGVPSVYALLAAAAGAAFFL